MMITMLSKSIFRMKNTIVPVSKYINAGHYRPSSKTLFEWRFTGGLIVALDFILTGVGLLTFCTFYFQSATINFT